MDRNLRRRMVEAREARANRDPRFTYHPVDDSLREFHITFRGPEETPLDGIYHGKITLAEDHPNTAPTFSMLTPSGRYTTGENICIDGYTSYHPESWSAGISLSAMIIAITSFMNEQSSHIGELRDSDERRRTLAEESYEYCCPRCQKTNQVLMDEHHQKISTMDIPITPSLSPSLIATVASVEIEAPDLELSDVDELSDVEG